MFPILSLWGGHFIQTYNLFLLLAYLSALLVWLFFAKFYKVPRSVIWEASFLSIPVLFIGGRLAFWATQKSWSSDQWFLLGRGGLVFYGALLAEILFLIFFFRARKVALSDGFNPLAPALSLAHAIGRMGCLANGCCHGKSCALPWAFQYTDKASAAPLNTPVHPSQVYEIVGLFAIFATVSYLCKNAYKNTFKSYLVAYALLRFLVEFSRGDPIRAFWGPLSTSQWVSILLLLLISLRRRFS